MDLSALLGSMSGGPPPPTRPSVQDEYKKPSGLMSLEDYKTLQPPEPPVRSDELYDEISPGYMTDESQKWQYKNGDGYYFVGANISSLFDSIAQLSQILPLTESKNNVASNSKNNEAIRHKKAIAKSKKLYNEIGEFIDADFEEALIDSVGFRNDSGLILKPEAELDDISSMREILAEAKKYNGHQVSRKITPFGLLKMTRILSKYRKTDNQWIRVATTCELIYKYLSLGRITRNDFFQSQNELPVEALLELEEFYNTDHIFMTPAEMVTFRNELEYYKYNYNGDGMQADVNKAIAAVTNLRKNTTALPAAPPQPPMSTAEPPMPAQISTANPIANNKPIAVNNKSIKSNNRPIENFVNNNNAVKELLSNN